MFGAVIPSYKGAKDKAKDEEVVRADDPRNRDKVRAIFDSAD